MHIRYELQFEVYVLEETLELLEETDRTCTRLTNTQLDQKARYAKSHHLAPNSSIVVGVGKNPYFSASPVTRCDHAKFFASPAASTIEPEKILIF